MATSTALTKERAARLYIQAHRDMSYTGLPKETRDAKREILRQLEHEDPQVRERALVGSPRHTGKLEPGERAHQAYMREQAGISHQELLERRRRLDTGNDRRSAKPPRPPARSSSSPATRVTRSSSRAVSHAAGAGELKTTLLTGIGVLVALSVLYLILSPGGATGFSGLLTGAANLIKGFLSPTDPFAKSASSSSVTQTSSTPASSSTSTPTTSQLFSPDLQGPVTPSAGALIFTPSPIAPVLSRPARPAS